MDSDQSLETAISLMQSRGIRRVPMLAGREADRSDRAWTTCFSASPERWTISDKEAQIMMRQAKSKPLLDRVARDIDRKLLDARTRLQETSWVARDELLGQIEDLRDRVRRTMSATDLE